MHRRRKLPVSTDVLLADAGTSSDYKERKTIYSQGSASTAIFFIQSGIVMLTVKSPGRRSAVISVLPAGCFFNEGCLSNHLLHLSTATTLAPSSVLSINKTRMIRLLRDELKVSALFQTQMLISSKRFRDNLLDSMVNNASQRLARTLFSLANLSPGGPSRKASIPQISQFALAAMIGTTRSRVNYFMNKFRKRRYISYKGTRSQTIQVHSSLSRALAKG
jgi:CRP/FNR family cyclic AMP-dependent transcriptional regulator